MKLKNLIAVVCALGGFALGGVAFGGVKVAQTIKLVQGWNAVYITVAPDETADEIFGAWPVEKVGVYDPAAFLMTKQYSQSGSTEGTTAIGFRMWYRDEPDLSQIKRIAANTVYVCLVTNSYGWTGTVYGRPSAPRITWHPSSTNEPMNFVGFSLAAGQTVTLEKYFDGVDIGNVTYSYLLGGGDQSKFSLWQATGATSFSNGCVVVMTASKMSDWSGVLNVSPMSGLDFSTNGTYRSLLVRNASTKPRLVSFELGGGAAADVGDVPPQLQEGFLLRDETVSTNGWVKFSAGQSFQKEIAAGETLELTFALDRTKIEGPAGIYYGSILTIKDVSDNGSNMRVSLPIEVTSDGGAASEYAWPKGVWLAAGELDAVSFVEPTADGFDLTPVPAGGKMKVRLPLYVAEDGTMKLLQRFVYGTDADGRTHVYSARTEGGYPVPIGDAKRVSSSVLPIDEPVIGVYETTNVYEVVVTNGVEVTTNEVTTVTTNGAFGTTATFAFTVGERSSVSPFRHAFHPSHDGLKWDFKTETPSGDDFSNYVSTVKPETFSVVNRVTFAWDESSGTAWTPEERLSGVLAWELDGVRHEGTLRMTGRFTMRRITDATLDK